MPRKKEPTSELVPAEEKKSSSRKKTSIKKKSTSKKKTTSKKKISGRKKSTQKGKKVKSDLNQESVLVEELQSAEPVTVSTKKSSSLETTTSAKISDGGDSAMEEALRDLDRMMSVSDLPYRSDDLVNYKYSSDDEEDDEDDYEGGKFPPVSSYTRSNINEENNERLSVEAILGTHKGDKDDEEYDDDAQEEVLSRPASSTKKSRNKSRFLLIIPILVFVVALLLVANSLGLLGNIGDRFSQALVTKFNPVNIWQGQFGNTNEQNKAQTVSVNVMLSTDPAAGELPGILTTRIIETDVRLEDTFLATGEAVAADARSVGVVTVTNKTQRVFHFVSSTRFLSAEGILFRLKSATNIPANESVDVEVYADEVGPAGDIGPTSFTIPGLSETLQQSVYGNSSQPMTGGDGKVSAVSAEDIEMARAELLERLQTEAVNNFSLMIEGNEKIVNDLITSQVIESLEPEMGQIGSSFNMSMSVSFRTLVIPEEKLVELLGKRVDSISNSGTTSSSSVPYEFGDILYTVEAFDTVGERAELRVESSMTKF